MLDFGIAHAADGTSVTRSGVMTGTPGWISPEYYRTGIARPEGDMFAWGTLVTYAATGRLPFGAGAPTWSRTASCPVSPISTASPET